MYFIAASSLHREESKVVQGEVRDEATLKLVAGLSDGDLSQTKTRRVCFSVLCVNPRVAHGQGGIPAATTALLGLSVS